MIYVDSIFTWPTSIRCFKQGSCHLFSDTSDEELHAFAARIGLKRTWFQVHPTVNHYDLTPARRARALAAGATEVSMREWLRKRLSNPLNALR